MIEQWRWVAKSQSFRRPAATLVFSPARSEIFGSLSCSKGKRWSRELPNFAAMGSGGLSTDPLASRSNEAG